jgi:hypothetical protein
MHDKLLKARGAIDDALRTLDWQRIATDDLRSAILADIRRAVECLETAAAERHYENIR